MMEKQFKETQNKQVIFLGVQLCVFGAKQVPSMFSPGEKMSCLGVFMVVTETH